MKRKGYKRHYLDCVCGGDESKLPENGEYECCRLENVDGVYIWKRSKVKIVQRATRMERLSKKRKVAAQANWFKNWLKLKKVSLCCGCVVCRLILFRVCLVWKVEDEIAVVISDDDVAGCGDEHAVCCDVSGDNNDDVKDDYEATEHDWIHTPQQLEEACFDEKISVERKSDDGDYVCIECDLCGVYLGSRGVGVKKYYDWTIRREFKNCKLMVWYHIGGLEHMSHRIHSPHWKKTKDIITAQSRAFIKLLKNRKGFATWKEEMNYLHKAKVKIGNLNHHEHGPEIFRDALCDIACHRVIQRITDTAMP